MKEAHDMHIPVGPRALVEIVVLLRAEPAGQERREKCANPCVKGEREDNLVDVKRQRGQREEVGERLGEVDQGWRRCHREWVFHGCELGCEAVTAVTALSKGIVSVC